MVAITAAIAAAALGVGLYEKSQGDSAAKSALAVQQQGYSLEAQAAQQQASISAAQAQASVGFAQQNLNINTTAAQQSVDASNASAVINSQITQDSQAIQHQRQIAMELDARRQSLQAIRTQQQARSQALVNATSNQGSGATRGSGLAGGYGQISGQSNVNLLGIQQNLGIGENIYGINTDITKQNQAMVDLNTLYAQQRAATQTQTANLAYQVAQSNAGFQTQLAGVQSLMAQGQGVVNQSSGQLASAGMQQQLGSQLISSAPTIFSTGMTLGNMMPTLQNYMTPTTYNDPYSGAVGNPMNLNSMY